jgi:hypothetical protein
VKRFEVMEIGREPLPAIDLADDVIVIGSGTSARIRLPVAAAKGAHLRIEGGRWHAGSALRVNGVARAAGDSGELAWGEAMAFELGGYRVRIADAPRDAAASSPQRTESLARELVRSLLGAGAAPAFELLGSGGVALRRELAPPESVLVIGRGDEADWVILDEDLSREHVEVRRGWEGVTIRDLGSKNGTVIDGARIPDEVAVELHDGTKVTLADVELVFRDPAERHLRGEDAAEARAMPAMSTDVAVAAAGAVAGSRAPVWIAAAIAVIALLGLGWLLIS